MSMTITRQAGILSVDVWENDTRWVAAFASLSDARAFIAAPDLLAALVALREHHKNEYQSDKAIDAQADAAIAKAKGSGE